MMAMSVPRPRAVPVVVVAATAGAGEARARTVAGGDEDAAEEGLEGGRGRADDGDVRLDGRPGPTRARRPRQVVRLVVDDLDLVDAQDADEAEAVVVESVSSSRDCRFGVRAMQQKNGGMDVKVCRAARGRSRVVGEVGELSTRLGEGEIGRIDLQ